MKKTENAPHIEQKSQKDVKLLCFMAAAQAVILIVFAIMIGVGASKVKTLSTPLSKWRSDQLEFKNGAWYVDPEIWPTEEEVVALYGPYVELKKGSYVVTIDYDCDSEQHATMYVNGGMKSFLKSGNARLYTTLHRTSFAVQAKETIANAEVRIKYDGWGYLRIKNITIRQDMAGQKRLLVYFFALFLLLDLLYLFYDKLKKNRETLLLLTAIVLLSSLPLFYTGLNNGHDMDVHMMRIEGIADSLRSGAFPVRISSVWLEDYGYPISIYYGDILLYLPALLRICGFDVTISYKVFLFAINITTAIISYYSFKRIFSSRNYGLLLTLVYCTASYRLVNLYVRSAVGEFSSQMFMPMIALAMHGFFMDDTKNKKEYGKNTLLLAIGMTGLVCSHVLSTEMAVFVLVLLCLVLISLTLRPQTVKGLLLAAGETILLSAYFIVPFLDYYLNVKVRINDKVSDIESATIQNQGIRIAEYFSFFRDPFSGGQSIHMNHRLLHTPGLILMGALMIALYLILTGKKGKRSGSMIICVGFSILSLYLASNLFPWNVLSLQPGLGNMLAQVQFPWRYVSVAIIFMTLLVGFELQMLSDVIAKHEKQVFVIITAICFVMTSFFLSSYLDDSDFVSPYDWSDLYTCAVSGGEYIRSGAFYGDIDGLVKTESTVSAEITERKGVRVELDCASGSLGGYVTLPVFNYKGYHAYGSGGEEFVVDDGENCQIRITVPPNYRGNITVDFKEPLIWRISEVISLLTAALIIISRRQNRT